MGENPSPSGEDFSGFAVWWNIIGKTPILRTANRFSFEEMAVLVRDLIREICNVDDVELLNGHVFGGYVYIFSVDATSFICQ